MHSPPRIPMLDLGAIHEPLRQELFEEITRVVDSEQFILGEPVRLLEQEIASHVGARFAVGCASGSDALLLALVAAGIGPGDTVLTAPFSFFATAGSISHAGAVPVFVDIDPETFNIAPMRLEETWKRHDRAKAVIPVHLYGGCADMDPVLETAGRYGATVIEDGAQAIGAEYKGRQALTLGAMGCLSFFPSKNLGAFGDAGMVVTQDSALADRLSSLRVHGSRTRYVHDWIGFNSRLDTLQAAILRVKLRHLDKWTEARQRNAGLYRELLRGSDVRTPESAPYQTKHVYNQFVIRAPRRDALRTWLEQHGIGSAVYYPIPLHLQTCYRDLGYREGAFPEAEKAAGEVLALPIHPGLSVDGIAYVSEKIRQFYG